VSSPIEYAEDQRPVMVVKKPCGCYIAALCLSPNICIPDADVSLRDFVREFKDHDVDFEVRPVAFVRQGGLEFNCTHKGK
jgi:hypothetical protein